MNKLEITALRATGGPKRKALALALVAAVREQGASMEDLEWAYEAVHHELETALRAKAEADKDSMERLRKLLNSNFEEKDVNVVLSYAETGD